MIIDIKTKRVLIDDQGLPELYPEPTTKDKERAVERYEAATKDEMPFVTWNKRYREFCDKVKSNNLSEVAEVYGRIKRLESRKDLSFGEKKMLDYAYRILVKYDVLGEENGRNSTVI